MSAFAVLLAGTQYFIRKKSIGSRMKSSKVVQYLYQVLLTLFPRPVAVEKLSSVQHSV